MTPWFEYRHVYLDMSAFSASSDETPVSVADVASMLDDTTIDSLCRLAIGERIVIKLDGRALPVRRVARPT